MSLSRQRASQLRAKHSWTERDRLLLCLLKEKYARKFVAPIWSHINSARLAQEGFRNGIPPTSLDAQFQEVKLGNKGHDLYVTTADVPDRLLRQRYPTVLDEIDEAIRTLKLSVHARDKPRTRSAAKNAKARARARRVASIPATVASVSEFEIDADVNVRPSLQQFTFQQSPYFAMNKDERSAPPRSVRNQNTHLPAVPPQLISKVDADGNASRQHPVLLFRATPVISSYRSRKHPNPRKKIPPPPALDSTGFKDIVRPHLERDRIYPSPFISFAQNPRYALSLVEKARSAEIDKKMFLVIFEFNAVAAESQSRYGDRAGPYLVKSFLTAGELSDLPNGYKGCGEWLVYGSIDCEPVAVLDSASAIRLAKALRRLGIGEAEAVLDISASLKLIPAKWHESVTYHFLRRYCGESRLPKFGTRAYKLLMQVIYDGQESSLANLIDGCGRYDGESECQILLPSTKRKTISSEEEEDSEDGSDEFSEVSMPTSKPAQTERDEGLPVVRRPDASSTAVSSTIKHLNAFATKTNPKKAKGYNETVRDESRPMWSSESEFENEAAHNAPTTDPPGGYLLRKPLEQLANLDDEWDTIDDDLNASFREQFPSTAKNYRATRGIGPSKDMIVSSIELHNPVDAFMAELMGNAEKCYACTSQSTRSRTIGEIQEGKH